MPPQYSLVGEAPYTAAQQTAAHRRLLLGSLAGVTVVLGALFIGLGVGGLFDSSSSSSSAVPSQTTIATGTTTPFTGTTTANTATTKSVSIAPGSTCPVRHETGLSSVWLNYFAYHANSDFSSIPAYMDFITLASLNPDLRQMGCTNANGFGLLDNPYVQSLAHALKQRRGPTQKLILSFGGSNFRDADWCQLVEPWLPNGLTCDTLYPTPTGPVPTDYPFHTPCQTAHGWDAGSNTPCSGGSDPTVWTRHINDTNRCANGVCYCCCGYNYHYSASLMPGDPCTWVGPGPPPPPPSPSPPSPPPQQCDFAKYPKTRAGNTRLMLDMLAVNFVDGYEFDAEYGESKGYFSAALVALCQDLKTLAVQQGKTIYLITTLFAGDNYGQPGHPEDIGKTGVFATYNALYDCFVSNPCCPIDYTMFMTYPICSYIPLAAQQYYETYTAATHSTTLTPVAHQGPFYWDVLLQTWTTKYTTRTSNTQLMMAVTLQQHMFSDVSSSAATVGGVGTFAPCAFGSDDITLAATYDAPTDTAVKPLAGIAFWELEAPSHYPTPGTLFNWNNTLIMSRIQQWQHLHPPPPPSPPLPPPPPSPPPPPHPPYGPYVGWGTTTQFGGGEGVWPPGAQGAVLDLRRINAYATVGPADGNGAPLPIVGAAIPFKFMCINSGPRGNWMKDIVLTAAGITTGVVDPAPCYLVEPINDYPDHLTPTDPNNINLCTQGCTAINSPALKIDGVQPVLVVPYEGCGGDGTRVAPALSIPDCTNTCPQVQDVLVANLAGDHQLWTDHCHTEQLYADLTPAGGLINATCACLAIQAKNNYVFNPNTKPTIGDQMRAAHFPGPAVTAATNYGRTIPDTYTVNGHVNYCMGENLHFDIAALTWPWTGQPDIAYIPQGTASTQSIVRYQKVPCNFYGNLDLNYHPCLYFGAVWQNRDTGDTFCESGKFLGPLSPRDWYNLPSITPADVPDDRSGWVQNPCACVHGGAWSTAQQSCCYRLKDGSLGCCTMFEDANACVTRLSIPYAAPCTVLP